MPPWPARHLPALAHLATEGVDALRGDSLVHADLRGDNVLRTPGGQVVLVDWPWAVRGAPVLDAVSLLLSGLVDGGLDPQAGLASSSDVLAAADPDQVTAVLAGLAGFFTDAQRRPPAPGVEPVRQFQRIQSVAALAWLQQRTGWP